MHAGLDAYGRRPSARILLVDDFKDMQVMIQVLLEQADYAVATVSNGQEALHYLERGNIPDLIVLDLNMPVMDGREFRRMQLEHPSWKRIPVILFSSDADARQAARELRCDGCLPKSHGDLVKEIGRVLRQKSIIGPSRSVTYPCNMPGVL